MVTKTADDIVAVAVAVAVATISRAAPCAVLHAAAAAVIRAALRTAFIWPSHLQMVNTLIEPR